jgi:hypothetical protein
MHADDALRAFAVGIARLAPEIAVQFAGLNPSLVEHREHADMLVECALQHFRRGAVPPEVVTAPSTEEMLATLVQISDALEALREPRR